MNNPLRYAGETYYQGGFDPNANDTVSILQVVREAGMDVPHSCEEGVCGACETRVISGIPDHRDTILTESERKENATMMICCSGSKTPRLVLDI